MIELDLRFYFLKTIVINFNQWKTLFTKTLFTKLNLKQIFMLTTRKSYIPRRHCTPSVKSAYKNKIY